MTDYLSGGIDMPDLNRGQHLADHHHGISFFSGAAIFAGLISGQRSNNRQLSQLQYANEIRIGLSELKEANTQMLKSVTARTKEMQGLCAKAFSYNWGESEVEANFDECYQETMRVSINLGNQLIDHYERLEEVYENLDIANFQSENQEWMSKIKESILLFDEKMEFLVTRAKFAEQVYDGSGLNNSFILKSEKLYDQIQEYLKIPGILEHFSIEISRQAQLASDRQSLIDEIIKDIDFFSENWSDIKPIFVEEFIIKSKKCENIYYEELRLYQDLAERINLIRDRNLNIHFDS